MLFNSYTFVVFLAVLLLVYHLLPLSWRLQKGVLLVASYLFYAAWNPPFVALLWFSTLVDWNVGKRLGKAGADGAARSPSSRRALLLVSLLLNLGLLAYFKYGGFALDSFAALLKGFGVVYKPPKWDVILPVGISFYTFQTLSYTIDIYRGKAKPWTSFLDYALYVTFFPQLVAGPIVRATDFLDQCLERPRVSAAQLQWGLSLLIIGLFEKVELADSLFAPVADAVFKRAHKVGFADAWLGTLAFSGQIFCDFAGYSTCAIGAAMCFGFALPDNFRFPYAAAGFSDFWQRWHISLSSWLRDYLYIPLGGNRRGNVRTYVNLTITMLLGGLWHGASWTFVAWGALHGLFLVVERLLQRWLGRIEGGWKRGLRYVGIAITFACVCYAWVFFRATSFANAANMLEAMSGLQQGSKRVVNEVDTRWVVGAIAALLGGQLALRNTTLEAAAARVPWWLRSLALGVMLSALALTHAQDRSFIYFQF